MYYSLTSGVQGISLPRYYQWQHGMNRQLPFEMPDLTQAKLKAKSAAAPLLTIAAIAGLMTVIHHPAVQTPQVTDGGSTITVRDLPSSDSISSSPAQRSSSTSPTTGGTTTLESATTNNTTSTPAVVGGRGGGIAMPSSTNGPLIDVIVPPNSNTTQSQSTIVTPSPSSGTVSAGVTAGGTIIQAGVDVYKPSASLTTPLGTLDP